MNEKGLRPYNWTGLSYNEWRNVVPQRKRQWDGEEFQELELKKPNQHFVKTKDGGVSWDNKAGGNSDYSDMIYTSDLQCMQKPYPTSRYEKNLPEFSFEPWEPEELTPPSAPTGLSATAISTSEIDLTWNAVDDALYYYVYRDGVYVGMASLSHYSDTGLSASTEYSYTVSAVNTSGESEQSNTAYATTVAVGEWSDDFNGESLDTDKWLAVNAVLSGGYLVTDSEEPFAFKSGASSYGIFGESFSVTTKVQRNTDNQASIMCAVYPYDGGTNVLFGTDPWQADSVTLKAAAPYLGYLKSTEVSVTTDILYLRMIRSGDSFTFKYSTDGSSYTEIDTHTCFSGNASMTICVVGDPIAEGLFIADSFTVDSGMPAASPVAEALYLPMGALT